MLYDLTGKVVWTGFVSEGQNTIDFTVISTGNYMMAFESENYNSNTRIVVQK
jgi:hypothetical protein